MRTIKVRLTLWYALLLFLTLALFSVVTYLGVSHSVLSRFDRSIETEVGNFARESEIEDDGELDLELEVLSHGERVAAYDMRGHLVAAVGASFGPSPVSLPALGFDTVAESGACWRRLTVDAPHLGMRLQVARSREEIDRSLSSLFWFLLAAVPLTVLVAGAGGLFLASRLLNPLDRITRAASTLGASQLSRRLAPLDSHDELSRLVDTFNGMLERLQDSFNRQKQFTSDAAHELRTPLAHLLSRAELTLSRPRSDDEYVAALSEIGESAEGMSAMVGKLLSLARADAGETVLEMEPLDLAELASDAVETMRALHPEAVLRTELGAAPILGDQTRLTELVLNLLENALKYSPTSTPVSVSVRCNDGRCLLTVSDRGPGVTAVERERIFDRFYRAELSRTPGAQSGTGLGLAICRTIARQHQGDLWLESTPHPEGATFVLMLTRRSES